MQAGNWQHSMQDSMGDFLPTLVGAIAIILVGWIVATVAGSLTRKGLARVRLNERLATHTQSATNFERMGGRLVFWVILLMALVAALNVLQIAGITGPLIGLVTTLVPAIVLAVAAWLLATVVRVLVTRLLAASGLDEQVSSTRAGAPTLSYTTGEVAFWLVLLLFLPAIVGILGIEALTAPLSNMLDDLLGMLPNLIAAAIIGVVGWIVARVVRGIVGNLLAATGIDRFSEDTDATRGMRLSELGGTLAFILVIIPTLIAALDALRIEAISRPLTDMLDKLLFAVPNVLAAAAILLLAWFIGRFVARLVARLLANLGFDRLPERIGLGHVFAQSGTGTSPGASTAADAAVQAGEPPLPTAAVGDLHPTPRGGSGLSGFAGRLLLFAVMLFATVEAAALLGFDGVHDLVATFIVFGADILLGLVILAVGYWLADLAARAIERASPDGRGVSRIARFAILGLVTAMGLRAMGVADDIVRLAFGLVLGAIAVAVALAFGLGGRDAAGQIAQRWASQYLDRPPRQ